MVLELRNVGNQPANNVTTRLRSTDARFVITDSLAGFGSIPAGATRSNAADPFAARADEQIPLETPIPCDLFISGDSYCDTVRFSIVIGEIRTIDPIPDGPRAPALYWAYDDVDVLYPEHPSYDWVETRGRGTMLTLSDDQTVTVDLPSGFIWKYYGQSNTQLSICGNGFVMPGYGTSTLWTNTTLPNASSPAMVAINFDDLYPPIGGGVWYFHDAANHRFVVEWDSVAYYSPQTSWDKFELVIYDTTVATPSGDNVLVAQYLTANNYVSNTVGLQDPSLTIGIQCLLDNSYHRGTAPLAAGRAIKYTTVLPTSGVVEEPGLARPGSIAVDACPNPFQGSVVLSVGFPAAMPFTASIYDNAGRRVRRLTESRISSGRALFTWDGRNDQGSVMPSGVYTCVFQSRNASAAKRVTLLR
jgi:hypothetical protein